MTIRIMLAFLVAIAVTTYMKPTENGGILLLMIISYIIAYDFHHLVFDRSD